MRLIDGDKLLKWLEYWLKSLIEECAKDRIKGDVITRVMDNVSLMPELKWTPVSEGLPNDFERVLVTWKNTQPEIYYQDIKDVPFADTAVHYKGKWYWWDATIIDYLKEYGDRFAITENSAVDKFIEVTAWMRLPEPWEGEEE